MLEDIEVENENDNRIKGDEVVKVHEVEWEAMEVDEEVSEKTAWAGESLKRSEASGMGAFRQKQEEDGGLKETGSLQRGEVPEKGSAMQLGDDMKFPDLEPVEVGTVLTTLL